MKEPIVYKILQHLYDRDAINEDAIDITDFLKTVWNEGDTAEEFNNLNRIRYAMNRITEKSFASFSKNPGHHDLNEKKADQNGNLFRCTLHNTSIYARITTDGYDYITDQIRKHKQDELLENTITTNSSLQAVNKSNTELNLATRSYYGHLKAATWVIAIATIFNFLAILLPLMIDKKANGPNGVNKVATDTTSARRRAAPTK